MEKIKFTWVRELPSTAHATPKNAWDGRIDMLRKNPGRWGAWTYASSGSASKIGNTNRLRFGADFEWTTRGKVLYGRYAPKAKVGYGVRPNGEQQNQVHWEMGG